MTKTPQEILQEKIEVLICKATRNMSAAECCEVIDSIIENLQICKEGF